MRNFLRFGFVLVFLGLGFDGVGQSTTNLDCGTKPQSQEVSKNLLKAYQDYQFRTKTSLSPSPSNVVNVPIVIHDVLKSDGTGEISLTDILTIITYLNIKYSGVGIQFYRPYSIDYSVQDDNFYNYGDPTLCTDSKEVILCSTRDYTNAINIYFVGSITGASGFSKFPTYCDDESSRKEDNRIFIAKNSNIDFISKYVVPHEFGHYFSLFHTFREISTEKFELVTRGSGKNCNSVADQLCDTDADPYVRNSGMDDCKRLNILTGHCFWGGSTFECNYKDSNNQSYTPPINNQMSYWIRNCLDDLGFTNQQYQRIASGYDYRVLNPNPILSNRYYIDGLDRNVLGNPSSTLLCSGSNVSIDFGAYGEPSFYQGNYYLQMKPVNGGYIFSNISPSQYTSSGAGRITGTIPSNTPTGYYQVRIYKTESQSHSDIEEKTIYVNGTVSGVSIGEPIFSGQYLSASSTRIYNATSTCVGNIITLYEYTGNYDIYWWTKDGLNYTSSSTDRGLNATQTGTYTLNMTKCNNVYRSSNSIYLKFYDTIAPSITASSNGQSTDFRLITCEGSPVTLSTNCSSGVNPIWSDGSTSPIRYINASSTRDFMVNCNNYFCNVGYSPPVRITALNPNVQSTKTGNWQDVTLWTSSLVPLNCQTVTIQAGHTVNVLINDAKAKNIIIKGNLNFQNVSPTVKGKVGLGI